MLLKTCRGVFVCILLRKSVLVVMGEARPPTTTLLIVSVLGSSDTVTLSIVTVFVVRLVMRLTTSVMDGRPAVHAVEVSQNVLDPDFQLLVAAWAEAAAKRRLTAMIGLIRMVPLNSLVTTALAQPGREG